MNINLNLTLILLSVCLTATVSFGQEKPDFSQPISSDSLATIYSAIDQMDISNLNKVRESYIYRSRISPTEQNKEILKYVEERITVITKTEEQ